MVKCSHEGCYSSVQWRGVGESTRRLAAVGLVWEPSAPLCSKCVTKLIKAENLESKLREARSEIAKLRRKVSNSVDDSREEPRKY